MRSFSISIYGIRISNRINTNYYKLDQLPSGQDFFELLNQFLKELKTTSSNNESNQELLKVSSLAQSNRTLSGFIERGEYGIESRLVNIDNEKTSYKRKEDDAELLPYYFLAVIPKNKRLGILAIQRSGLSGIKTPFEDALDAYLQSKESDCRLQLERLVPSKVIEQYLTLGRVSKIRFVKFVIPHDIADFIHEGHEEKKGSIEMRVTPKMDTSSSFKNRIMSIVEKEKNITEFFAIPGFEYNTVKIEFDVNGKKRTIDLSDPSSIRADYDVTKNVEIVHGNPTYESINDVAREIVRDITESMQLEAEDVQQD